MGVSVRIQVAIITGAASGFGRLLSEKIIERGGRVVIGDINKDTGTSYAEELKAKYGNDVAAFTHCDVSEKDNIHYLFKFAINTYGTFDIVVNNAGYPEKLVWNDPDGNETKKLVNALLFAPIEGTRISVRYFLKEKKPGCILNIGSSLWREPAEFLPVYSALKSGVTTFTAACVPLSRLDPPIRVNVVEPNASKTGFFNNILKYKNISKAHLHRFLTPEDVVVHMLRCIEDESLAGRIIDIDPNGKPTEYSGLKIWGSGYVEDQLKGLF